MSNAASLENKLGGWCKGLRHYAELNYVMTSYELLHSANDITSIYKIKVLYAQ
jgi:hypothetical protein